MTISPRALRSIALALCVLLPSAHSSAHDVGQSYVFLDMAGDAISVRVEINVPDVNRALGLGLREDMTVSPGDVVSHATVLQEYVRNHLTLAPDGKLAPLRQTGVSVMATSFVQFVQISFTIDSIEDRPSFIDVDYRGLFDAIPDHVAFLVVENNWLTSTFDNESEIALTFNANTTTARLDLSSSSVLSGFNGMVAMGIHHIWIGIDHILFLLAVLLPSVMRREGTHWHPVPNLGSALKQVVKIVTVFTAAHTITLSLATLNIVSLPPRLVESIIAISIAVVAFDIVVPTFRNWTYSVVLAFGLFHGFGFASVLSEMPIPASYMALSLLGFNVGVEIGQIVIVCAIVPVLFFVRRSWLYPRITLPAGAAALIVISVYWFVERAFEVDLPAGAIVNRMLGWA